jgi:hypothetical protein
MRRNNTIIAQTLSKILRPCKLSQKFNFKRPLPDAARRERRVSQAQERLNPAEEPLQVVQKRSFPSECNGFADKSEHAYIIDQLGFEVIKYVIGT